MANPVKQESALPPDDLSRKLALTNLESGPHIGLVGDTYTITVSSEATAGKYCVIDMHVPPGGGPPPHRHDFEETFIVLDGEIEATFRGEKKKVSAGSTIHIPANAPHQFKNVAGKAARLICICSPGGQEKLFEELGVKVATSTTPPPKLSETEQKEFVEKAKGLSAKYKTEFVKPA
jgi:quercetin dioxygenase-like cupin family protein